MIALFYMHCLLWIHTRAHLKVSTKQKADKAMLTIYHRFLCTQSHLYSKCHCLVSCTVCPSLFCVAIHIYCIVFLWDQSDMFSLCQWYSKSLGFYVSLQYLTWTNFPYSKRTLVSHFIVIFIQTRSDCNSSGNATEIFKC